MHKRVTDFINYCPVKLGIFTGYVQFHLFIQLLCQIPYHFWIFLGDCFNWHHSDLHNRLMKICCHSFKILNLLIEALCLSSFIIVAYRYKSVFGNNQLTYKIHQYIQLFNIYSYRTADNRFSGWFPCRCIGSLCRRCGSCCCFYRSCGNSRSWFFLWFFFYCLFLFCRYC